MCEAFHQHQPTRAQGGQVPDQRQIMARRQLFNQHAPPRGSQHHLARASVAMPPTVAPDFAGVNIVVGVLDHRQINAIGAQAGNEFSSSVVLPLPE